jgi:formylglycine-generating enzyme required for sulfatase activity
MTKVSTRPSGAGIPLAFGVICLLILGISACDRKSDKPPQGSQAAAKEAGPKPFKNEVYRTIDGSEVVTITSLTELELRKGRDNFICEYTRQDDGIRVVLTVLGTKQAVYLSTFSDPGLGVMGLKDGNLVLLDAQHYRDYQAEQAALGRAVLTSMKLVLIPAGKFMMGSPENEKDRGGNEGPQREVTISKAFHIGAYDVTQEQYERIMGNNPSNFKGAQNPVESVSWHDAAEFCRKLSQASGKTVRLPTEAQWEYASRAGTKTRFSYGDDNDYSHLGEYAWYGANSEAKTHPVGQKKPNPWGLYDMNGNVWQWCADWYADTYADAKVTDPTGPASGTRRVLRGGSRGANARGCRCADRWGVPDGLSDSSGFRVVVDLE